MLDWALVRVRTGSENRTNVGKIPDAGDGANIGKIPDTYASQC